MRRSEWEKLERLLKTGKDDVEILKELEPRRRNGNGNKAPEGGISLRAASRKYGIPASTLSDWLREGFVHIMKIEGKYKFIKEIDVIKLSKLDRRVGVRTIEK